ncbi:MAG: hypothetical protein DRO67_00980 [Candidatus Asgardarchaeum californiense]|nr:MAG: hypothetical protein DRO67_00980 [Candidatus Asgardarchaeum californiense]
MSGFKAIGLDLRAMEKQIKARFSQGELVRIFNEAAKVAYDTARDLCPVDTGFMRGQIKLESLSVGQIYLSCDCRYAIYNEYGWYGIPEVGTADNPVHYKGGYRPFMRAGRLAGYRYFVQEIKRQMKSK